MPQLDQLINAMVRHKAEALILEDGQKPALLMDGTERSIVKTALAAAQISQLIAEIAPGKERLTLAGGGESNFTYELAARPFDVEVSPGPKVVIRTAKPQVQVEPTTPAPLAPAPEQPADATPAPLAPAPEQPADATPAPTTEPAPAAVAAVPATPGDQAAVDGVTMDKLLRTLVDRGGSDLHLSSECPPKIRTDGELADLEGAPELDPAAAERLLLSIAPERNRAEIQECGDTDFAYEIEGLCRFRCNLFQDRKGMGGVFRVIPSKILTVDDLALSEHIRNLCFLTKGLVLVTGPTGSGKSTTLCALVDHVNTVRRDHVITIEDPIEFVHNNRSCLINQREVHMHTRGFKPALRAALREDPDVVLVGEMRDLETVAIAIETAETGHLVFGTLHTSSAVSTVDRIIDQFPADQQEQIRIMLSESLRGVIAQVLCKKIGGGRIAALEVLMVNAAVSNLIREGKTFQIPSIMQTGKKYGNILLNAALLELVKKKLVEPQEAYLKAMDKHNLLASYRQHNISTSFLTEDKAAAAIS
jgi:twitching motility protein PilT